MALLPEITARYSSSAFSSKPLEHHMIVEILEAGRLAPSAKNRQAWRFVAISRQDLKEQVAAACYNQEQARTAACFFACCTTNLDYRMPNGQFSYPVDLGIAGAFMMLQATHLGLGSCPISTFDEHEVKRIITMPGLMKIVLLVAVGFPENGPPERSRLPYNRVCTENHW